MSSQQITALRKQGQWPQALELARTSFATDQQDIWLLRAYGWVLHDQVKSLRQEYDSGKLGEADFSDQMTQSMREFARFGHAFRGDLLFSRMVSHAVSASKIWKEFLGFARWAGLDSFRAEDQIPYTPPAGRAVDSLVLRFVRAVGRCTVELRDSQGIKPDWLTWGQGVFDQALRNHPGDQWLNYYRSRLLLAQGETDQALKHLLPIVQRQSNAAWPWALLGEVLDGTDAQQALICDAYACELAREEQMVARVRIRLAHRLAGLRRYDEAAEQIQRALVCRENNGWRIPAELQQLASAPWFQSAVDTQCCKPMASVRDQVNDLLRQLSQSRLEYRVGMIDHVNAEKNLSYVLTAPGSGFILPHRKFPGVAALTPGALLEIGFVAGNQHPLGWKPTDQTEIPGLCQRMEGQIQRMDGKPFAFLRASGMQAYIPPQLLSQLAVTVDRASCLAGPSVDKKTGKPGWRVLRWTDQ